MEQLDQVLTMVVLWTVLANAMKRNSAYMDIIKECYIFVKRNIMIEYHEAEYQKVPKIPSQKFDLGSYYYCIHTS